MFEIADVVAGGLCIGCGTCAVMSPDVIHIEPDDLGMYRARISGVIDEPAVGAVCPFSDRALNEDEIGSRLGFSALPHDPRIGWHSQCFAARRHVISERVRSSSGGTTSWLIERLLEDSLVDGVIHVDSSGGAGSLFDCVVSESLPAERTIRKSASCSTTLAHMLTEVRGNGRRYAVVGVPCFVKAARLLAAKDPELGSQLRFFIGLVCGHMKSRFFGESLAWQLGVAPDELASVDFRVKVPGRPSSDYAFRAYRADGRSVDAPVRSLVGSNWGHAVFQPAACDFCDDIFAETADVVFGDAWLPRFTSDWSGWNVVVVRDATLQGLLERGVELGEIDREDLTRDEVSETQTGNFRHRREGLAVRLSDDIGAGKRVPRKRIPPSQRIVSAHRRAVIRKRRRLASDSSPYFQHALATRDLQSYLVPITRQMRQYDRISNGFVRRVRRKVPALLRRLFSHFAPPGRSDS